MSKLLENIIRRMLFEQIVRGKIFTLVGDEKKQLEAAGAVQGFKFVVDQEISDEEWAQKNTSLEKTSINLGRHYQKNIVGIVNQSFTDKPVTGYNDVLDENHVVIIGNTPAGTESFSIMFWVFTKETFNEFSKRKTEDDTTPEADDHRNFDELPVLASRFKILQAPAFVYDEYLNVYTSTNEKLSEINQGVNTDVVTLAQTKKNTDYFKSVSNKDWPKKIRNQTCYAFKWFKGNDYVTPYPELVINIEVDDNNKLFKYSLYDYNEWIRWTLQKQNIKVNKPGKFKQQYKINSNSCSINKDVLFKITKINADIEKNYTSYDNKLFDIVAWKQKNITEVSETIKEKTDKQITEYTNYINTILNRLSDAIGSNYLHWSGLLNAKFDGNLQNLYEVYDKELRQFALTKRSENDPNKWVFDDGVSGYQTERGKVIHDTGIEYLETIRDSLRGYTWYISKCKRDQGNIVRTYLLNEDTVKTIEDSMYLLSTQSYNEYFELLGDKLQQAGLNTILPPDIDSFDDEVIPVEEP
jgi:hypothetical protein